MRAYSKETKEEIKKLLKEHVKEVRTNIPWTGENDLVTKKIIKLFRKTAWPVYDLCVKFVYKW